MKNSILKMFLAIILFWIFIQNIFAFDYILWVENKNSILSNESQILDLDVLDSDKDLINKLKQNNKFLIAYINAWAIENYREDYNKIPKNLIWKTYPWWEDENFLDIKNYKNFKNFILNYLDVAKYKWFDAIEFDNIDTYDNFEGTWFKISKDDELSYLNFLEKQTHKRGLKIYQKNAPELVENLVKKFDWAIVESWFYENFINDFLAYIKNNKPVYNIEYTDNLTKEYFLKSICPKSKELWIVSILKNRNLDEFIIKCPVDKNKIIIDKYTKLILNYSNKKNINLEVIIDRIEKLLKRKKLSKKAKIVVSWIIEKLKEKVCYNYYPIHKNIMASVFWVWEGATASNAYISNKMSAWDEDWLEHSKNENAYYFALPYNDFDENWNRRLNSKKIPWYKLKKWKGNESIVKNRWVKIIANWKIAFAQWEDVGPLEENDFEYVFWDSTPKNTFWLKAWIDLSPKLASYLGIDWSWIVDWNFIPEYCVNNKIFKEKITNSNINWK